MFKEYFKIVWNVFRNCLENDLKIYWDKYSVARLERGKDYLKPEISLIIDDMIESSD